MSRTWGRSPRAGGAFTADAVRHKLAVLGQRCAEAGRPVESILRTGLLVTFLAESPAAARAKFNGLPPDLRAFFEHLPVVGTPEDAIQRVQATLDAGFQYVIFIVFPFDPETLRLLAERVIPAVTTTTAARAAD